MAWGSFVISETLDGHHELAEIIEVLSKDLSKVGSVTRMKNANLKFRPKSHAFVAKIVVESTPKRDNTTVMEITGKSYIWVPIQILTIGFLLSPLFDRSLMLTAIVVTFFNLVILIATRNKPKQLLQDTVKNIARKFE
jgi:hypothetical protein